MYEATLVKDDKEQQHMFATTQTHFDGTKNGKMPMSR